jgi:hypothetical protein
LGAPEATGGKVGKFIHISNYSPKGGFVNAKKIPLIFQGDGKLFLGSVLK